MKKILVINGHPNRDSFNFGLFEAYKNGLEGRAHTFSFYVEKGLSDAIWENEIILDIKGVTYNKVNMFTTSEVKLSIDRIMKNRIEESKIVKSEINKLIESL